MPVKTVSYTSIDELNTELSINFAYVIHFFFGNRVKSV